MSDSLTAPERETVINWTEADDMVTIWTAQRPTITRLRKLPAFTEVRSGFYGTTAWAEFTCPVEEFRIGAKRQMSATQRLQNAERLAALRSA